MTSSIALGNPFALGAGPTVQTSARTDRLALAASFRPSATALGAVSGFLAGPAGTMGDLTLLSDTLLRIDPFLAVIQGTHNSAQGQYTVPNTQQRDLTVPAKDASLIRRALIVVRVADSLEAGVATSGTTDGAWVEILPGALVSSNPQLPSMTAYANYVAAGELTIPSVASGLPVTLTKYNPRTTSRGGILPVTSTDTAAGLGVGDYRDHPTAGLQRWNGTTWTAATSRLIGAAGVGQTLLAGTPGWTDLITFSTVTGGGGQYFAEWDGTGFNGGSGLDRTMDYRVTCDGISIGGLSGIPIINAGSPRARRHGVQTTTPGIGAHTWTLQANASAASAVYVEFATFRVTEKGP